jgi:NAD(P)-dependent dehydrogenase (short-subunit alcohol dehydrogenase family)
MGICQNRVVIVTGAGRGLGRSHALTLASEGARVIVNDRGVAVDGTTPSDEDPAPAVVKEIIEAGGDAVADTNDVASWDGAARLIDTALGAFGRLDGLVCNAGNLRDRMLVSTSEEDWDAVIGVHLKGHFCPLRHAAGYWRNQIKAGQAGGGAVVLTTSGAGLFGNLGQSNYSAAKAGIAILGRVAAAELGRYGVRVNIVAPVARTRMTTGLLPGDGGQASSALDRFDPASVSAVVAWLLSEDASEVSGETLEVNGGYLGVMEAWRRGPSVASEQPWTPSEIGGRAREILADRFFVPVAGTPEWAAWDRFSEER